MRLLPLLLLLSLLTGGVAQAADDPLRAAVFRSQVPTSAAAPAPPEAPPGAPRDFGMPQTAVERRFGGVTGAAGFLCGLQPTAVTDGAAAAYGVDPHGRFVGVKLKMTLR